MRHDILDGPTLAMAGVRPAALVEAVKITLQSLDLPVIDRERVIVPWVELCCASLALSRLWALAHLVPRSPRAPPSRRSFLQRWSRLPAPHPRSGALRLPRQVA